MGNWSIKPAQHTDAERIENFLLTINEFKYTIYENTERALWQWQFVNPSKHVSNVLIAEDTSGSIIAHYALLEICYMVNRQELRAGLICKLAVAEEYRKQLLFFNISFALLNNYKPNGVDFAYGLINRKGLLEAHRSCGFTKLYDIPVYIKPYRLTFILSRMAHQRLFFNFLYPLVKLVEIIYLLSLRRIPEKNQFIIEEIKEFTDDITAGISTVLSKFTMYAKRSKDELNHRFINVPYRDYRIFIIRDNNNIHGYFVIRRMLLKGFNSLVVADICIDFNNKEIVKSVVQYIDKIALSEGVELTSLFMNPVKNYKYFKKYFYFRTHEYFTLIIHNLEKLSLNVFLNANRWFITWYDHDYV